MLFYDLTVGKLSKIEKLEMSDCMLFHVLKTNQTRLENFKDLTEEKLNMIR